jgi:hypothetical protein
VGVARYHLANVALLIWFVAFVGFFAGLGLAAGPPKQRRPHFWVRVLLLAAVPAVLAMALAVAQEANVLPLWISRDVRPRLLLLLLPGLVFVPSLLYRNSGSPPGPEEDGGGGSGPEPPRPSPLGPPGGVPLPDADQARTRVRDHSRPAFDGARHRRSAREPRRRPAPTSPQT